jgi:hypothetical protein
VHAQIKWIRGMFCLDHLHVYELDEPTLWRLSPFKLRNNLFSPFVRILSGIFKNNEVTIVHAFQQKDIHCLKTNVIDGTACGRFYTGFDSVSKQSTLTDNCLKEISANAGHLFKL